MAQPEYEVIFRKGRNEKQASLYQELSTREIVSTRYCDEACLRMLGLYDSVNFMLDSLHLNYFLSQANPVYVQLTLEFLSSLKMSTVPNSNSTSGTINFRMFNHDYTFSFHDMADLLHFPHTHVVCEVTDDELWSKTFVYMWKALTGKNTTSFEGNRASAIHNPAVRYFRQLLAGTIFGRANSNKVNSKELYYLFAFVKKIKINSVPFMFNHMRSIVTSQRGTITFGGLITTIAKAIGLEHQLRNLPSLPISSIDFDMVKSMKLVKEAKDGHLYLMINNSVFREFVFPNPERTDVRGFNNFLYFPPEDETPMNNSDNVATDRGHTFVPPAHNTPLSNPFAGPSSSSRQSTIDDVLNELRAQNARNEERDGLFYAIHQQQEGMMEQMNSMQTQQTLILQNQHQLEAAHARQQQQLDRVIYDINDLRLQFDNFHTYPQPPP
ncbi:unnamed protein product [Trifolium pratense]|uniref:Uncharacterized protein n=1 Tax=Trifolium pratense TaxID=57577 RepID=A0ACB0IY36_TRIPR|nr:unnamed protein product [Trifolium pratense]